MIAVDTNVLIRILVDDPGASLQMKAARALLANSEALVCTADRTGGNGLGA